MFNDILGREPKTKVEVKNEPSYILIKDEGFSKWFQCTTCRNQFETDVTGMNCTLKTGTGPTGRGRHLEPACPFCEPHVPGRH
jgi:primosomal protein N'